VRDDLAVDLIEIPDEALELLNKLQKTLDPSKNEFGIKLPAIFLSKKIESGKEVGKTITTVVINPAVVDIAQVLRLVKDVCEKKLSELGKRKAQ
jgi:hypothetical protein